MRYAIGDIHGGSKTFRALLNGLNLKQSDRLFLLGDYVDRGNDSKGVLDTIWELLNSGYDVRPIRGNHDDMFLRNLTGDHNMYSALWYEGWGPTTLASFGTEKAEDIPAKYLTLLDAMPFVQVEDDFVLVHAALDMTQEDPISQTNELGMMWGEIQTVKSAKIGGRTLVTGHNIRPLPLIEVSMLTNRIYLDNGAFTGALPDLGNLVALNMDTMELYFQPWLDGEALP